MDDLPIRTETDSKYIDLVRATDVDPNVNTEPNVRFIDIVDPSDRKCAVMYPEIIAGIVGVRATNIDSGSPAFVKVHNGEDSKIIALREILERKCPIKVRIPLSNINGKFRYEEWSANDMLIPPNTSKLLETLSRYLPHA